MSIHSLQEKKVRQKQKIIAWENRRIGVTTANGYVLVRILVQVEADEEKTAEKIEDDIPPKTFRLFGAVHNPTEALKGFPAEREDRRCDQQKDPNKQKAVLPINQV
ncbi:MAG: hypothetical protein WA463_11915 [Terriglobales bacterium]